MSADGFDRRVERLLDVVEDTGNRVLAEVRKDAGWSEDEPYDAAVYIEGLERRLRMLVSESVLNEHTKRGVV